MELKLAFAVIANIITVVGYAPYIWNIFAGRTKPHAFSWLIWFLLTGIAFFAQAVSGGGTGSWVTGFSALVSGVIFVLAVFKGTREYTRTDLVSLGVAGVAIVLWLVTDNPLLSVLLVTVTDAVGFIPTFRKSYNRPDEETALAYGMAALKFGLSLFALQSYSLTTWLYPASLVLMNGLFTSLLLVRRRQLKQASQSIGSAL